VRNKKKACESVGIKSVQVRLAEDSSEEEVLKYVSGFNDDPSVHGVLVQLPLPSVNKVYLHILLHNLKQTVNYNGVLGCRVYAAYG